MAPRRNEQQKLISSLQATIEQLNAVIASLQANMATMQATSQAREAELLAKLNALLKKTYGKSSEKMPPPAKALNKERAPEVAAALAQEKRKRNQDRKAELATETVTHAISEGQRACPECESVDMVPSQPVERIDYGYVPGYFRRRVHRREVLVCNGCKAQLAADAPPRPFEKSPYEAGLIAHVVVQKCACSVPIYRLEKQFQWLGIPLSRSTMTDLFHAAAEKLRPLYQPHRAARCRAR